MPRILRLQWLPLVLLFAACERTIEFRPQSRDAEIVVEGVIETGQHPMIYLSRSIGFFDRLSPETLAGTFIHDAVIRISDGEHTHLLKEYERSLGDGFSMWYYSADSSDLTSAFTGVAGGKYSLTIETGGKTYTAETTIPSHGRVLESLQYTEYVDSRDSTKVVLYGNFFDPPGKGDYSRYFISVNDGPFLPGYSSVDDDRIVDGQAFTVQIDQGVARGGEEIDFDGLAFFRRGDHIRMKFCNIDRATFEFWRTMEYNYSGIGNPFASPGKVKGNISNGGLGYFGGYAVRRAEIKIPE